MVVQSRRAVQRQAAGLAVSRLARLCKAEQGTDQILRVSRKGGSGGRMSSVEQR
jgi:hypothetical protein